MIDSPDAPRDLELQGLRERIRELDEARAQASQAKDEFLAILGHELRNPLAPILTALELMNLRGETSCELERAVIQRQITHLTRLVDDLMDVAGIARGRVELRSEIVELSEIVSAAIEMVGPLLERMTHAVAVDVPRLGLRVDGDRTRLNQIVSNLVTNAAKYTPPGGAIVIHARRVGDDVVLSVRDSGIGIDRDMLPRVFDLFVQERQSLDRSRGGLGLGLTIVRGLVERHRGSVTAHSDGPGKGSEFEVRLPYTAELRSSAVTERIPVQNRRSSSSGPRQRGVRVLVVDDNEDAAELLSELISERGYVTRVAHDAPTALRVAAEFSPDIAFLDIGLPVMDGYQLAGRLRETPELVGLQLIAVTGYGQRRDRQRSHDAGFHRHLVKPVRLDDIDAALAAAGVRRS